MLASLRNGHATVARLACRPIVGQHVRAKATATALATTTVETPAKQTRRTAEKDMVAAAEEVKEPTKRPRGRPRKAPADEEDVKEPAKRPRGRPRKAVATSEDVNEPAKRPRGRPRKAPADDTAKTPKRGGRGPGKKPAKTRARSAGSMTEIEAMMTAKGPLACALSDVKIWRSPRGRRAIDDLCAVDPRRVNIVSPDLCDSIIKYLGPSLERHRGCDLVDLNPGVGLWSQKLHDFLEPRRHILMDRDAELYRPFLAPLLDNKGVELLPKSGIVWKDLLEMMDSRLAHQAEVDKAQPPTRNDTLLVTVNLSTYPKKTFYGFDSVSTMVFYQLLANIRSSSMFQRYGLVRMLVWVNDEDKKRVLPRSIPGRRRSAFEAELSCEWLHEVAGLDAPDARGFVRDWWLNAESCYRTVARMAAQGLTMPHDRMTRTYAHCMANPDLAGQPLAAVRPPDLDRPFRAELEQLETAAGGHALRAVKTKRLKDLRLRDRSMHADSLQYLHLLEEYRAAAPLAASSPADFAAADARWNEAVDGLKKNPRSEFKSIKDNYLLFAQLPPALLWDRRAIEPLRVDAAEFFPNAPSALLDIQPKAMRPVFRQYGPSTSRSGDMSDAMLRFWFHHLRFPVTKAMDCLWGGFGDLAARCPSLTDPACGGSPFTGHGALVSRAINEQQWAEILQAWVDWPFRPTYVEMLGRMVEEIEYEPDEDESKSAASGVQF